MSLPPINEVSEKDIYKLVDFYRAHLPHSAPMNTIQLRMEFGKPEPQVSHCNVKGLHKVFVERYYMCGGLHRNYDW